MSFQETAGHTHKVSEISDIPVLPDSGGWIAAGDVWVVPSYSCSNTPIYNGGDGTETFTEIPNIVAQYNCNDNAASTAVDDAANNHECTLSVNTNVISSASGKTGRCLNFNNTATPAVHYGQCANTFEFTATTQFAVFAQIAPQTARTGVIFGDWDGNTTNGHQGMKMAVFLSAGSIYFHVYLLAYNSGLTNVASKNYLGTAALTTGGATYYSVGFTYDGANGLKLYVNGVELTGSAINKSTDNTIYGDIHTGANLHYIGRGGDTASGFDGKIDSLVVFKGGIPTASQIALLGSNMVMKVADTSGIALGDRVTVSSDKGTDNCFVASVTDDTSVTVDALAVNHCASNLKLSAYGSFANTTTTYSMTFVTPGDQTLKYQKGRKVKFTQDAAVKYGIITKSAYYAGETYVIVFLGSTAGSSNAITLPYYSREIAPDGFDRSRTNWNVSLHDTNTHYYTNPVSGTYYGDSVAFTSGAKMPVIHPLGDWHGELKAVISSTRAAAGAVGPVGLLATGNGGSDFGVYHQGGSTGTTFHEIAHATYLRYALAQGSTYYYVLTTIAGGTSDVRCYGIDYNAYPAFL